MLLKYFYDKALAQASYLVGCAATGEALVVDPSRDIQAYLTVAGEEGLKITHVTETHIHADYVSGSRELAAATGATLYLSDEGDANWKYQFIDDGNVILVTDGDMFMVGNIKVEVMHTPGHTPEHISFMITDTAGADQPIGVFTGDYLFVGDVGRPDLLEEAAGIADTKEPGAREMFKTVARFKDLPDYLQIWPAHGAGSACGKALGAIPSTTLGYEKLFNPAFQLDNEDAFVDWLLDGQPEAPFYFAQMKKVNKEGPALLNNLPELTRLDRASLDAVLDSGSLVLDLRTKEEYAQAYVPGTVNVPMSNQGYVNYIGWLVSYDAPVYLIVPQGADVEAIMRTLRSIGVDNLSCYFVAEDVISDDSATLPQINAAQLAERIQANGMMIIDVRGKSEYQEGHIVGAVNIPLGYLKREAAARINHQHTIVTQCASGYRSAIAASVLKRLGYDDVINLSDGQDVWSQLMPTN
ncbi:MAG: rhodanese-like domain-containing protein [Anaerolineae bacterium]